MNNTFQTLIKQATGATELTRPEIIQSLWSGYGQIVRYGLIGADRQSIVAKHVRLPETDRHPRGWNTDHSHERKIKSYQVETTWYDQWSPQCDDNCRIPHCLALEKQGDEVLMVLEDLNESGFAGRRNYVSATELRACLQWLAHFHATFMGAQPDGLWEIGTYWHLATRPDELERLDDLALKKTAGIIDRQLNESPFQTLVHGDAKLANFCFSKDGSQVAAVDFQYVGGGCGMKDVAYFISSCLNETESEQQEEALLNAYFTQLRAALTAKGSALDLDALEASWRELYPVAWTDFYRFLQGWSPGHWKIHRYSERLASEVLARLK
jgi:hypothetical protein